MIPLRGGKHVFLALAAAMCLTLGIVLAFGQSSMLRLIAPEPQVPLLRSDLAWGVAFISVGLASIAGMTWRGWWEAAAYGLVIHLTAARSLGYVVVAVYTSAGEAVAATTGAVAWGWVTALMLIAAGDRRRGKVTLRSNDDDDVPDGH